MEMDGFYLMASFEDRYYVFKRYTEEDDKVLNGMSRLTTGNNLLGSYCKLPMGYGYEDIYLINEGKLRHDFNYRYNSSGRWNANIIKAIDDFLIREKLEKFVE